jgi:hypothetical protein
LNREDKIFDDGAAKKAQVSANSAGGTSETNSTVITEKEKQKISAEEAQKNKQT